MAKPRSPILGYNHNVRYRGLVLHVQTEDSGITNPHVFTHLFYGGVILSTRKLVYDADASEESVKSLMQAQHKAVMRDLKKGVFDDKMDAYLGGTPGLLPRGVAETGADAEPASAVITLPVQGSPPPLEEPAPPPPPRVNTPSPSELAAAAAAPVPFPDLPTMPIPSRTTTEKQGTPTPSSVSIPRPGSRSGRMPAVTFDVEARAPTIEAQPLPPLPPGARGTEPPPLEHLPRATTEVMIPDDPLARTPVKREVSAAFEAIMVAEGELMPPGGGLVEVHEDDVGEIHDAAPGSAPIPPGAPPIPARAGEYAQHRRRESGRFSPDGEPVTPPPNAPGVPTTMPLPAPSGPTSRGSQPRVPAPPVIARPPTVPPQRPSQQRVATPPTAPPAPTAPLPRATTQVYSTPAPRTTTPPATPPPRPGQPRTRSPGNSGVVVTRPAVIIGAPSRTIGGSSPPAPPPPSPAAPAPTPAPTTGQMAAQKGRVRKAREDTDSGVFGQDLISEKSLDEVILAYLSEDGTEE